VRRAIAAISLFVACAAAACVIGPKQDDPAEARAVEDAGFIPGDTGPGGLVDDAAATPNADAATTDTATTDAADTSPTDAGDAADTSDAGDAPSDAPTDVSDAAEGG